MTALSADRATLEYLVEQGTRHRTAKAAEITASTTYYYGGLVSWSSAGKLVKATDSASDTGIAGICLRGYTSASTPADPTDRMDFIEMATVSLKNDSTIALADVGKNCFVVDDQTVGDALSTTNDVKVGRITRVEGASAGDAVWVRVGDFSAVDA